MDTYKSILLTRALPIEFRYVGFGAVNPIDVTGGPRPKLIDWQPIASNMAARFIWQVEINSSKCMFQNTPEEYTPNQFKILQIVEDTVVDFDEEGAAVITTSGKIEVAGTPAEDGFLNRNSLRGFAAFFNKNTIPNFNRKIKLNVLSDHRKLNT